MNLTAKNQTILLLIVWLLVQTGLYVIYGIDASKESLKYIGAANSLIEDGYLPSTRYFFYLTTTLIITFALKTGIGFSGVVAIQLLLNLFATFTFFQALQKAQQKRLSAFITTLLLISFIPYQAWNFFLYTESVFYSCVLLFFSSCIRHTELSVKNLVLQGLLLGLTIISRPLGIIFLPCWILYLAIRRKINPVIISLSFLLAVTTAIIVINTIMSTISDWQILKPAEYGYIICDIPSQPKLNLDNLKQHAPLTQLGLFLFDYPFEFLQLSIKRLNAFYLLYRSYYSQVHNVYMLFYAALFTLPFIFNAFVFLKNLPTKTFFYLSLFIVIGFTLAIILQCDDYHNRFHHAIVPVFLYGGIYLLLETLNIWQSRRG